MTDEPLKPFPAAADPIAGMFGIQKDNTEDNESTADNELTSSFSASTATAPAPKELPVIEGEVAQPAGLAAQHSEKTKPQSQPEPQTVGFHKPVEPGALASDLENENHAARGHSAWNMAKTALPYLAVFVIGILVYYFYFTNADFSSWLRSKPQSKVASAQTSKGKALAALEKAQLKPYQAWIDQFFFDVSDPNITAPETDFSGNGLTNFQNYLLNLNPKAYDSIGSGTPDGITVANGNDPATGQSLVGARKDIVDKYFDTQAIRDRVTKANLNGVGSGMESNAPVNYSAPASSSAAVNSLASSSAATSTIITRTDPTSMTATSNETVATVLPRGVEPGHQNSVSVLPANQISGHTSSQSPTQSSPQSSPQNSPPSYSQPSSQSANLTSPSSTKLSSSASASPKASLAAGSADVSQYENVLGINTNIPAQLNIPKLGITAPVYFSKSVDDMYTDLKNGVAHLTGAPLPGDHGTSYIVGHSSNYAWVVSKYKRVFATLDQLADGETFTVTVILKNGQQRVITYKVAGHGLYLPDDQSQFVNFAASRIALSTCWPLNTTQKRLVVFGEVVGG